ncbi:EpsG family protein [Kaistella sp. 97-N-M2]|uniref:EpsG family protein n=1 Tax=Kaistella sp. 97-N-M2 TaxID=2908645 RepID=UPI001F38D947|nr:EpsG family protein [Kaistella sp. 97-N-M2]UJF29140.1 EpsG family protein [Kaistella sp. 97-N-M2]
MPVIVSVVLLIVFAGVRVSSVGTDTNNYVGMYNTFQAEKDQVFQISTNVEIGYLYLEYAASLISTEYWALLFCIASVCVICYLYVITKLSHNVLLSVFIYIALGTYVIFFNAARQGIAVSISAISLIYLIEKKMWKYFLVIAIASLFHRTVLIMLPFYFILRLPFTYKRTVLFAVVGVVSFYFLSKILSLFDSAVEERYAVYEDRGATGGYQLAAFYILITLFLIYARKFFNKKQIKLYDIYLNYALFTSIIYLVVVATNSDVNFIRLTNYFALGNVFIFPLVFKNKRLATGGLAVRIFVVICLLFYAVYLSKMANLTPYLTNPGLL